MTATGPAGTGSQEGAARPVAEEPAASGDGRTVREPGSAPASRDQASRDQASRDQASRDQASRDQASRDQDGRLPSLWALTVLEQQRQWRLSAGAGAATPSTAPPEDFSRALEVEVERIREEVGTPGSLSSQVDPPISSGDAALVFHATRQLLGLLVPHTQAFDLKIDGDNGQVRLELTCSGWEGDAQLADGVAELLEAVTPAGGDLELDALSDDQLRATLKLPVRSPAQP